MPGSALAGVARWPWERGQFQSELRRRRRIHAANGDDAPEGMLNDIGVPTKLGVRVPLVESVFEYGSRSGVWRVLRAFKESDVKVSVLGVVRALEQNPRAVEAFLTDGHEIVSHGW